MHWFVGRAEMETPPPVLRSSVMMKRMIESRGGMLLAAAWALFVYAACFSDWVDHDGDRFRPPQTYRSSD